MTGAGSSSCANPVPLPPGQHVVGQLPPSTCPPPVVTTAEWELSVVTEHGVTTRWDWAQLRSLPSRPVSLDLHCVAGWSVLASTWDATCLHHLFDDVTTDAEYALVESYTDYSANLPLEDLLEMPTWLAYAHEGQPLSPERGGPVRLLVPHLYLWKSVKWVHAISLGREDRPGTRERAGYHNYGDPWRQQRTRCS